LANMENDRHPHPTPTDPPNQLLDAALEYARAGWAVFPVHSPRSGGCSCHQPCTKIGKHPRTKRGLNDATTDPAVIRRWWERWPDANVAIRTGAVSKLAVLDVDPRHGGVDSLRALDPLPETAVSETGGGGYHIAFAHPGGHVKTTANALGPGLDIRADGGYIVAPPSLHASGKRYAWKFHPSKMGLAALPEKLNSGRAQGARAERVEVEPASIPEGARNATLASIAGTLRRFGLQQGELASALLAVNSHRCLPPLEAAEVRRIANSIARYDSASDAKATVDPFGLTVLTAKAFCEQPEPPRASELLGPLVVRGQRLVIGGHTGQGKTTFSFCLAAAIALDREFLGWTGAGGRVLIIDAEQGRRTIQRRLREMGLDECEHIDFVSVPDGLSLDSDESHIAEVDRILREGNYTVVLADPLYKLHRGDSNDERESTDLMRRFDAWREQYEFALILPVHCRKPLPSSKFSIHDLFGSTAYLRGAEVVVGLQFVRSGYSRLHFFKDRDGDLPQGDRWGLLFDRESGFRRDPEDGKPRETAPDKLRRLLAAQPGMTERQLIEASGYAERTVRDALKALGAHWVRSGSNGEKSWTLPEDEDEA
jgi:hypothetical protein